MLTDAVEVRTRLLGRGNEATLASLNNLAIWYQANGARRRGDRARPRGARPPAGGPWRRSPDVDPVAEQPCLPARQPAPVRRGASAAPGGTYARRADARRRPSHLRNAGAQPRRDRAELRQSRGGPAAARAALSVYRLQPGHPDLGLLLYQLAEVAVRQSDGDKALDLLVEAVRARALGGDIKRLSRNPHLAPLLTHPRVEAVLANPSGQGSPPS